MSAQRYIYICKPYLTKQWCTVRRSVLGIILAFLVSSGHVSTRTCDRHYTAELSGTNARLLTDKETLVAGIPIPPSPLTTIEIRHLK